MDRNFTHKIVVYVCMLISANQKHYIKTFNYTSTLIPKLAASLVLQHESLDKWHTQQNCRHTLTTSTIDKRYGQHQRQKDIVKSPGALSHAN